MAREILSIADAQDRLKMLAGIIEKAEIMYERTGASGATVHEYKALKLLANLEVRDVHRAIDRGDSMSVIVRLVSEAQKEVYALLQWVGKQLTYKGGYYREL